MFSFNFSDPTACPSCKNTLHLDFAVDKGVIYLNERLQGATYNLTASNEAEAAQVLEVLVFCPICIGEAGNVHVEGKVVRDEEIMVNETGTLVSQIIQN